MTTPALEVISPFPRRLGRLARLAVAFVLAAAAASLVSTRAHASTLVDRTTSRVDLQVDTAGEALLTYEARGAVRHVLVWGAVDAVDASSGRPQVAFSLDYAGGWRKYHRQMWRTFKDACRPYDGPQLAWVVAACTAPDGSYWAVQRWSRDLPDYGTARWATPDLRVSHWTGPIAHLTVRLDWAYRRYHHLFGRFTYRGTGVFGDHSTSQGTPLDDFGRNLYIDTYDSRYGTGWRRENAILTHRPTGAFCYGFYPHGSHPAGRGTHYRATIIGPGVTPDVTWEGTAPGRYVRRADRIANRVIRALRDPLCKAN